MGLGAPDRTALITSSNPIKTPSPHSWKANWWITADSSSIISVLLNIFKGVFVKII
jgi:hypothetical protein